uniref:60S ribosomal protein L13 n=1 Tax=Spadella cephaloptera TaxID=52888 RepID=A8E676_9BILA|nr:TPA: putative 60S ribosomal protein L13 [Spadella cephaloptera]
MAPKHNNQIQNAHFKKDWQNRVRTWFDQPARKKRRSDARKAKAAKVAPRPISKLRPIVRCPTVKYNKKQRLGRGFTLEEIKAAGLNKNFARTIGIAADYRRRNKSVESLQKNVQRLKEYRSKLILFPKKMTKPHKGDATKEEMDVATQIKSKEIIPVVEVEASEEPRAITEEEAKFSAYQTLRKARAHKRLHKFRVTKAKKKAEEEKNAPKKK